MTKFIDEKMRQEGSLDNRELCAKFTTDVVGSSIYGVESGAFTQPHSAIRELAVNVLSPSWRLSVLLFVSPIFPAIVDWLKVSLVAKKEADFMTQLLRDTLKYRKENKVDRQDFMDFLIQLKEKKGLGEIDLVSHCAAFFFDGIETSSITLSNIFFEVKCQERS